MEFKYDGYYEKDIIYKMTMEEFIQQEYKQEEMILALIREIGPENVLFYTDVPEINGSLHIPLVDLILVDSSKTVKSFCRMITNKYGVYNPLYEDNDHIHKNHWYSPYKIQYTSIEFHGTIETKYFSDFCSLVNSGKIEILDTKDIPIAK